MKTIVHNVMEVAIQKGVVHILTVCVLRKTWAMHHICFCYEAVQVLNNDTPLSHLRSKENTMLKHSTKL